METTHVDETSYRLHGDFLANAATAQLLTSFKRSMALDHKLHPVIAAMEGMSGRKYRYFINNLMEAMSNPRYLEIGSWAGSTACSAIYGNRLTLTCIDNWSQFHGPKDIFLTNIGVVKSELVDFTFIESDFRAVDYSQIGRFNVYMFDGPHEEVDQYDGVVIAQPALDDVYILIVDDWNWPMVSAGTRRALADTGTTVLCSIEILTTQNQSYPQCVFQHSEWHNGYFLAVCKKPAPAA